MREQRDFRQDLFDFLEEPETGDAFKAAVWSEHNLQYMDELKAVEGPLLRHHVFDAFETSVHKGVTYSLVWGYPSGRTYSGTENEKSLKSAMRDPSKLVVSVEQLTYASRSAVETIKKLDDQPGLGIASHSKVAYFAGLESGYGRCLIFDKQVTKAVFSLGYPELDAVRTELQPLSKKERTPDKLIDFIAQRNAAYPIYLKHAYQLARLAGRGTTGEDIERFLFMWGREFA